jgi:hypothetical protein
LQDKPSRAHSDQVRIDRKRAFEHDSGVNCVMTTFRRLLYASGVAVLALAAACAPVAQTEQGAGAVGVALQPGWKVLHCGMSRGVLYVTYVESGTAAIAAASNTAAVRQACAAAGYPVSGASPAPVTRLSPARTPVEPTFTMQASGSVIAIDGRNDGDTAFRCVLNFSWTFDDDPTGPRAVTTQATLAGRQVNRVVFISGPYRNVRFVGLPTWHCVAAD